MKIHRDDGQGRLLVSEYGPGYIQIGQQRHTCGVNLIHQTVVAHASEKAVESLTLDDLDTLLASRPEVILLGTGPRLRFPDMRILRSIQNLGMGCDVMDSAAACRTYNILNSEGRAVAAWLLMP